MSDHHHADMRITNGIHHGALIRRIVRVPPPRSALASGDILLYLSAPLADRQLRRRFQFQQHPGKQFLHFRGYLYSLPFFLCKVMVHAPWQRAIHLLLIQFVPPFTASARVFIPCLFLPLLHLPHPPVLPMLLRRGSEFPELLPAPLWIRSCTCCSSPSSATTAGASFCGSARMRERKFIIIAE